MPHETSLTVTHQSSQRRSGLRILVLPVTYRVRRGRGPAAAGQKRRDPLIVLARDERAGHRHQDLVGMGETGPRARLNFPRETRPAGAMMLETQAGGGAVDHHDPSE